jgi:hypothetical protein
MKMLVRKCRPHRWKPPPTEVRDAEASSA